MIVIILTFQTSVSSPIRAPTDGQTLPLLGAIDQDFRLGSRRDVEPKIHEGDRDCKTEKQEVSQALDLRASRLEVAARLDFLISFHF